MFQCKHTLMQMSSGPELRPKLEIRMRWRDHLAAIWVNLVCSGLQYRRTVSILYAPSESKSNPTLGHIEFDTVMLIVYKGAVCQQVALTMQPLEARSGGSSDSTGPGTNEEKIQANLGKEDLKRGVGSSSRATSLKNQ